MDGGREEASGGGIERGSEGARKQARDTSREVYPGEGTGYIYRRPYIHKPSHNAALTIDTLMKNSEHV